MILLTCLCYVLLARLLNPDTSLGPTMKALVLEIVLLNGSCRWDMVVEPAVLVSPQIKVGQPEVWEASLTFWGSLAAAQT